jgi:hypothetical protein
MPVMEINGTNYGLNDKGNLILGSEFFVLGESTLRRENYYLLSCDAV